MLRVYYMTCLQPLNIYKTSDVIIQQQQETVDVMIPQMGLVMWVIIQQTNITMTPDNRFFYLYQANTIT